jgi:hypothetical protein
MGLIKLLGKKPPEGKPQEFDNILWGTTIPVLLTLSSGIAQVRARGSCSVAVTNLRCSHKCWATAPGWRLKSKGSS